MNNLQSTTSHPSVNQLLHHNLIILTKSVVELENRVTKLDTELTAAKQQLKENATSGWLPLKIAANKFALTTSALRQVLKRKQIPEDIVWRQSSSNSAIFVNTNLLSEYL
jgi:hypothetical protein